jgi:hypothetical protein
LSLPVARMRVVKMSEKRVVKISDLSVATGRDKPRPYNYKLSINHPDFC